MAGKMYLGSIDLNKIDKSKVITKDKDGNPFKNGAKYLNIITWVNEEADKYGNKVSIQVVQTKEERESKEKAVYLGNLKEWIAEAPKTQTNAQGVPSVEGENDLPF